MDQHQTAVTAAFVMEGLHDAGYDNVIRAYRPHGGAIELVNAVMEWVPAIEALRDAADSLCVDYPGVFEYEVSSEFGAWLGASIIDDDDANLPDRSHAMGILFDLVQSFFRVQDDPVTNGRLQAVLDEATDNIMAPQAADDGA